MQFDTSPRGSEQDRPRIEIEGGLAYNPDSLTIEGTYSDELSLYRAKKTWCNVLESDFLLIHNSDFRFQIEHDLASNKHMMICSFNSACGRYAFWRLINEQVPEIQFLLETAHISHRFRDYASLIENLDRYPQRDRNLFNSIKTGIDRAIEQVKRITSLIKSED